MTRRSKGPRHLLPYHPDRLGIGGGGSIVANGLHLAVSARLSKLVVARPMLTPLDVTLLLSRVGAFFCAGSEILNGITDVEVLGSRFDRLIDDLDFSESPFN